MSNKNSIGQSNDNIPVFTQRNFTNLNEETQQKLVDQQHEQQMAKGGKLGKLFGTDKENAAINIGAVTLFLFVLIFIGAILLQIFTGKEINQILLTGIVSIITLILGYIFGKQG